MEWELRYIKGLTAEGWTVRKEKSVHRKASLVWSKKSGSGSVTGDTGEKTERRLPLAYKKNLIRGNK